MKKTRYQGVVRFSRANKQGAQLRSDSLRLRGEGYRSRQFCGSDDVQDSLLDESDYFYLLGRVKENQRIAASIRGLIAQYRQLNGIAIGSLSGCQR